MCSNREFPLSVEVIVAKVATRFPLPLRGRVGAHFKYLVEEVVAAVAQAARSEQCAEHESLRTAHLIALFANEEKPVLQPL